MSIPYKNHHAERKAERRESKILEKIKS